MVTAPLSRHHDRDVDAPLVPFPPGEGTTCDIIGPNRDAPVIDATSAASVPTRSFGFLRCCAMLHLVRFTPAEFVGGRNVRAQVGGRTAAPGSRSCRRLGTARALIWGKGLRRVAARHCRLHAVSRALGSQRQPARDEWFARLLAAMRPTVHPPLAPLGRGGRRATSAGATCVTAHLFHLPALVFRVRDDEMFCERPLAVESCTPPCAAKAMDARRVGGRPSAACRRYEPRAARRGGRHHARSRAHAAVPDRFSDRRTRSSSFRRLADAQLPRAVRRARQRTPLRLA